MDAVETGRVERSSSGARAAVVAVARSFGAVAAGLRQRQRRAVSAAGAGGSSA